MTNDKLKKYVLDITEDLVSNFLYYDRKEDEELSVAEIDRAFNEKIVSVDEVVEEFRKWLIKGIKNN